MTTLTITRCMDCPWQSNDWWCRRVDPPTIEEIRATDAVYTAAADSNDLTPLARIRGNTGPGDDTPPPDWCPLRTAPVLVQIGATT